MQGNLHLGKEEFHNDNFYFWILSSPVDKVGFFWQTVLFEDKEKQHLLLHCWL